MLVLFLLFTCPANRGASQESGPSLILTNSVVSGTQGEKKISLFHFYLLMIIVAFHCIGFIHHSFVPRYFPSVEARILFSHLNYHLVSGIQEIFLYFAFQYDVW